MSNDPSDETLESMVLAAGLERALAEHYEDVRIAARSALGYQKRRAPLKDMALEPCHVFRNTRDAGPRS